MAAGFGHTVGAGAAALGAVASAPTVGGTVGLTALSAQQADAALADYRRFFGSGESRGAQSLLTHGLTPFIGSDGAATVNAGIDFAYGVGATGRALRLAELRGSDDLTASRISFDESLNAVDRHLGYEAGRALAENPIGRASYDRLLRQGTEIRFVNDPTMRDLGVYEGFRNRVTINLPRHATGEEIASTVVHEAVHQNRYFRKIPPTTQYEEYLAFRNESLFINGVRPSLNERMRIWSYVQTLYPNLAQGRHPF